MLPPSTFLRAKPNSYIEFPPIQHLYPIARSCCLIPYITLKYRLSPDICRVQRNSSTYPMSKYLKAMNKMNKPLDEIARFSYLDKHNSTMTQREGFKWKILHLLGFPMSLISDSGSAGLHIPYHPISVARDLVNTYVGTQVSCLSSTSFFHNLST